MKGFIPGIWLIVFGATFPTVARTQPSSFFCLPLAGIRNEQTKQLAVYYLVPDQYVLPAGTQLRLRLQLDDGVSIRRVPWGEIRWFFVRIAGTQENRSEIQPANPQEDFVRVPLELGGVALIGLDMRPVVASMTRNEFAAFLKRRVDPKEGTKVEEAAEGKVRVRWVQSAKTLVRVQAGEEGIAPSATATSKAGQAVEICPLFDPTLIQVGSDLPLRAYLEGSPMAGVKVRASSLGVTQNAITDANGFCHLTITQPGVWRVEFHYAQPLKGDAEADWVLYSATLTFKVPG